MNNNNYYFSGCLNVILGTILLLFLLGFIIVITKVDLMLKASGN